MEGPGADPFTIRPCRPEDLDHILVLEKESFPSDAFDRETFSWILSVEPGGFLVAESGERLLGYVAAVSRSGEGAIYSIAVRPGSRRKGVGIALMRAALDYLSTKVRRVYLQVSVNNGPAIALYEGLSFSKVGRLRRYYPNGDDAFLMSAEIGPA